MNSFIKISNFLFAAVIIVLLTLLPYLHELLTYRDGAMQEWVPILGIKEFLTGEDGDVLNFSSYHVFLYTFFLNLFFFIGWLGWYLTKTNKNYRKAILLPVFSSAYQIILILSASRFTWLNLPEVKIIGTLILGLLLLYFYFPKRNNLLIKKTIILWVVFFIVSMFPYFHDILTIKGKGLRFFIPNLGIEKLLTFQDSVLGFNSYRVFIYVFISHIFAQIAWAGWFLDARGKLFRPFLLMPVIFNLYEITLISINMEEKIIGAPSLKLYMAIVFALLIAINLYFNSEKAEQRIKKRKLT